MRGMGSGYSQILIDGERPPPGFSIEQISPDMVERIELLRAPPPRPARARIAGTISIILREPLRQRNRVCARASSLEREPSRRSARSTRDGVFGEGGAAAAVRHQRRARTTGTHRHRSAPPVVDTGSSAVTLDQLDEDRRQLGASTRINALLARAMAARPRRAVHATAPS